MRYIPVILLFLTSVLLSSCLKDGDGCRTGGSGVLLVFEYTYNKTDTDLFTEQVDHVHLFIYDGEGLLVKTLDSPQRSLTGGNKLRVDLEPGNYRVVVWGNIHTDNYAHEGHHNVNSLITSLVCTDPDGFVTEAIPGSLFHSYGRIEVKGDGNDTFLFSLVKNTNLLNIRICNIQNAGAGNNDAGNTDVAVVARNGDYDMGNLPATGNEIIHISEKESDPNGDILARVQVLRLFCDDEDISLKIWDMSDSGDPYRVLFEDNLIGLIRKEITNLDDEYLDRNDEYFLRISFDILGRAKVELLDWEEYYNIGNL